ncbi:hypothetical protein CAPTEDRAFT_120994 [Capitella teleta]|uniref:G-protein coupled receptors family 1 profile domain-containing protein n=1 Tax=Capitella teleta TaxID=283909 RepID=R7VA45_CAPTE|nr:hypothetical protein CAPTEDRAFT_120994 [Capitella teleta]|eukprot:ELU15489.1 hypothetical protein CAPTEDRAFT_120994 [Capitella teleta]
MESTSAATWQQADSFDDQANVILSTDLLTAIYISIGCLGLTGNLLVSVIISQSKQMRKHRANIFILNQSVLDGSVAVFLILTSVYEDDGTLQPKTVAYELLCRLWRTKMPLWGLLVSSSYNLVVLTVERYLSIVYPIWHKVNFTLPKVKLTIVLTWIIGLIYNIAYMTPTATVQRNGRCTVYSVWPDLTTQRAVGVLTIAVQFVIPLVALSVCYGRMAKAITQRINPTETRSSKISRARKNVIKTLFVVSVCFVFCWIWNQTFYLMFNLGASSDFTSSFYHFTVIMVFCNCCINPFIYVVQYKQFQNSLIEVFCKNKIQPMEATTERTNNEPNASSRY